jgi:hypothetical protein
MTFKYQGGYEYMHDEQIIQEYERFFRDPQREDETLQPPISGIACRNIRLALRTLGYDIVLGDQYDSDLVEIVLRFQVDNSHSSCDGLFGAGTCRLLTKKLFITDNSQIFQRMTDPTKGSKKKKEGSGGDLPYCLKTAILTYLESLPGINDPATRQALIYGACLGTNLTSRIEVTQPPSQFFQILIEHLFKYGKLDDNRNALIAILEQTKKLVGWDKQKYCDDSLIKEIEKLL